MNATFLRDEGIVKQLPTGCESSPPYCRASYLRTLWRCYNTDQRDYVEHNWTLWFRSHGGLRKATAKIKREPHQAGTRWTSGERAANEIKREIMMNSQSVPKASFALHESDHVWSQRECQAWPSRKNFLSAIASDHRWPLSRAAEAALFQLSAPRRFLRKGRVRESRCSQKTEKGNEQDSSAGIWTQNNDVRRVTDDVCSFVHRSEFRRSEATRASLRRWCQFKFLSPTVFYWGRLISVRQWGDLKPFRGFSPIFSLFRFICSSV